MDEKFVANYNDQELKKLKLEIEQLNISIETKDNLLDKIDAAQEKNNEALQLLSEGNVKQGINMLKAESNIINAFINELNAQNGKEISTADAKKLILHGNNIKKGIEEGSGWILQENPNMKITHIPEQLTEIENKTTEIREIVTELQTRGIPVEIKTLDASELDTSKTNKNSTAEVHAIAPVAIVIVILGVEYVLLPIVAGYLAYEGRIYLLEKSTGKHVCMSCRTQIFEFEITTALAASFATSGAGWLLKALPYLRYSLTLNDQYLADSTFGEYFGEWNNIIGKSCNVESCPFYKGKSDPAIEQFAVPDHAHQYKISTTNVTIKNQGTSHVESCIVALYVNDELIGNVSTGEIGINETKEIKFNWFPEIKGNNILKTVIYASDDADESNNVASHNVEVLNSSLVKCELYKTKVVNSTSNPSIPFYKVYYFKAEHPVLLSSWDRTPTFMYTTSDPVYSPVGFQAFYPYGGIWQYYGDSPDGPWNTCFFNPYAVCEPGVTQYNVDHWAMGSGYHQYFAVLMCTTPGPWTSCQIKTGLNELWLYDKTA